MKAKKYPEGSVFYRNLHYSYPLVEKGQGLYLFDRNGNKYLDASGGAAVVNIGHGVKEVADAIGLQAQNVAYVSGMHFSHSPVENLAERISGFLPFPGGKVYFLNSGSEAVEASLKLARQYWVERGQKTKRHFISRTPSYHGNTLTALSLSARKHYQEVFQPMLRRSPKIPAPYCYRCYKDDTYPGCGVKCAYELDAAIKKFGRDNVAAFVTEVIGGATTGAAVPPPGYFEIIKKICDQNQVLLITDEVMTGVGRTGKWLASEHFDLVPDIIVLGKGLTGGYFPLSAVAAKKEIVDALFKRGKSFLHAQTFSHHPVGCAAGVAALSYIQRHRLVERCARVGKVILRKTSALLSHPHIGDIRGRGLLVGIEFVQDKKSKKPFPRKKKYVETFLARALEKGLVFWWNTGQADGHNGDIILLAPPYTITAKEIALIQEKMEDVLSEMTQIF
jgi:adenosylmethionine-8-amino-7-oxononanoate aminotransferase